MLAMAHVRRSTPTAGLEAILGVMPLDQHTQCVAVQAACRIRGRNRDKCHGTGCRHLRGHLLQVDLNDHATGGLLLRRWRTNSEVFFMFFLATQIWANFYYILLAPRNFTSTKVSNFSEFFGIFMVYFLATQI